MKRIILYFYMVVLATAAYSLDVSKTMWGPEKPGFGYYLKFENEKEFLYEYSGEGGGEYIKGTYTQNNNVVKLYIVEVCLLDNLNYLKGKVVNCIIEDSKSIFSKYKFIAEKWFEMWCITQTPENGEKCFVDGKSIYRYQTDGIINNSARLREGPGQQYKYYLFNYYIEYYDREQRCEKYMNYYNVVPKDCSVVIWGHSENKTEIDGNEEYWYYCKFQLSMWENKYGWIWGGLIDIKNSNK